MRFWLLILDSIIGGTFGYLGYSYGLSIVETLVLCALMVAFRASGTASTVSVFNEAFGNAKKSRK